MWRAGRWQDPEAGNPWGGAGSASSSVGRAGALGDAQIASLARQTETMLSHQAQDRRAEPCDRGGGCRARGLSSEWWDQREQVGVPSPEAVVRPMRTECTGDVGELRTTGETTACAETSTWCVACKGPHAETAPPGLRGCWEEKNQPKSFEITQALCPSPAGRLGGACPQPAVQPGPFRLPSLGPSDAQAQARASGSRPVPSSTPPAHEGPCCGAGPD